MIRAIVLLLLLCVCGCGCDPSGDSDEKYNKAFNAGIEARNSGSPANTNPYITRDNYKAKAWLDGWVTADIDLKKK